MASVHVTPRVALVDEVLDVQVNGLRPAQKVTLQARVQDGPAVFVSYGHFMADQQGNVNTATSPSLGGTYSGLDTMGLFWSMRPAAKRKRLLLTDVRTTLVFTINLLDDHVDFGKLSETVCVLDSTKCERSYKHKDVVRKDVGGPTIGTLFVPPGKGPFPGVIDMFGATGGLIETRAALLASRGFATLALAYLAYKDLPGHAESMDMNYFLTAVDWFSSHPCVQPGGVGIVAVSKGGEMAFALASCTDKVKAVVNINCSAVFTAPDLMKGEKVYLTGQLIDAEKAVFTDEGASSCAAYPDIEEYPIIPMWRNNAHILYILGGDDGCINTNKTAKLFKEKIPRDKRDNVEVVLYNGAGHLIEPPYMPFCRTSYFKHYNISTLWGGRAEPHAAAQKDAWMKVLTFLNRYVGHGYYIPDSSMSCKTTEPKGTHHIPGNQWSKNWSNVFRFV